MIQRRPDPEPEPSPDAARHARGKLAPAAALVLYFGLAVLVFASAWAAADKRVIGLGSDRILFVWYLRWLPHALTHGLNPIVTNYLDYPSGVNLSWSGLSPLSSLALVPVTQTAGPIAAYNLMATLAIGLSSWTAFLAIRRYVPSSPAAFAGGLLYGFSPAMMAQSLGHPQVAMAWIPPLLLLALDELAVRQRWNVVLVGGMVGTLCVAQLYSGEELLAAEVLVGSAGLVLLAGAHPASIRPRLGYFLRGGAVAGVIFLILGGPWLLVQFLGPQRISGGVLQPSGTFVTDLVNFVVPTSLQALAPAPAIHLMEHATGNLSEWDGYLGIPLLGLLIFSAIRYQWQPIVRVSAVLGLMLAMASLGLTLHVAGIVTFIPVAVLGFGLIGLRRWFPARVTIWTFLGLWIGLAVVPVLRNVLPARLMLFVFLFAGFLLAAFIREAIAWRAFRKTAMALSVAGLALLTLVPSLPFVAIELSTPAFFTSGIAGSYLRQGSVALIAPYSRGGHVDAMLWQAESGFVFRMPEGDAVTPGPSTSPPSSVLGFEMATIEARGLGELDPASIDQMRRDLQRFGVQTVIVGPMPNQTEMVRLFTTLLGSAPQHVAGVELWQGVDALVR